MEVIEIDSLDALKQWVRTLIAAHPDGAIYGLKGDLGAGKTTLVRSFIECLSEDPPRVTSPSYVLHQHYNTQPTVDHWDLYRLNALEEESLIELGYMEVADAAREAGGWVFVEWPDRVTPRALLDLNGEIRLTREADERRTLYWSQGS